MIQNIIGTIPTYLLYIPKTQPTSFSQSVTSATTHTYHLLTRKYTNSPIREVVRSSEGVVSYNRKKDPWCQE